jgi:hypothetical protein
LDKASLIAPIITVKLDTYLGDSKTIVTDGTPSEAGYLSIPLKLVTEAMYTQSLYDISLKITTSISITPGKYFKWIFETDEALISFMTDQMGARRFPG